MAWEDAMLIASLGNEMFSVKMVNVWLWCLNLCFGLSTYMYYTGNVLKQAKSFVFIQFTTIPTVRIYSNLPLINEIWWHCSLILTLKQKGLSNRMNNRIPFKCENMPTAFNSFILFIVCSRKSIVIACIIIRKIS